MKKRALVALAALTMSTVVPAMAQLSHQEQTACDLAAKNCLNKVDILQKRVKKINDELKKGNKNYSAEEMKKLEEKLKETQELLDKIEGKAPAK